MSKTLYDKIWDDHLVHAQEDGTSFALHYDITRVLFVLIGKQYAKIFSTLEKNDYKLYPFAFSENENESENESEKKKKSMKNNL